SGVEGRLYLLVRSIRAFVSLTGLLRLFLRQYVGLLSVIYKRLFLGFCIIVGSCKFLSSISSSPTEGRAKNA
ncbi:hypothetical protein LINPERHAP1_LOCUS42567, partial [Linum perenne]